MKSGGNHGEIMRKFWENLGEIFGVSLENLWQIVVNLGISGYYQGGIWRISEGYLGDVLKLSRGYLGNIRGLSGGCLRYAWRSLNIISDSSCIRTA